MVLSLVLFCTSSLVQAQTITSFAPTSGSTGTTVTIKGTGFTGASTVAFNGITGALFVQDNTTILTQVPSGATTGLISVTVGGNTVFSATPFNVAQSFPVITSFTPAAGTPGSNVTITGQNLNLIDSLRFNGKRATYNFLSVTSIVGVVPVGATTGPIELFYQGVQYASSGVFTVPTPPPTIIFISPTSGPPGTVVSVKGSNFFGVTQVTLNNAVVPNYTVHRPDSITFIVPPTATSGLVRVTTSGGSVSSSSIFQVTNPLAPTITSFTPTSGFVGTIVTVRGSNFIGTTQVRINATIIANYTVHTQDSMTLTIPPAASTGFIRITTPNGTATSAIAFQVLVPGRPTITSFTPSIGQIGTLVTVRGSNFLGLTQVRLNTTIVTTYTAHRQDSLTFIVPPTATTGVIQITNAGGTATSTVPFQVFNTTGRPTITNFAPFNGPVGTTVTINGSNFSGLSSVLFNGTPAIVTSSTNTQIIVNVPVGATTGTIVVVTSAGIATSTRLFVVSSVAAGFCSNFPGVSNITPSLTWSAFTLLRGSGYNFALNALADRTYSFSTCGSGSNTIIRIYDPNTNLIASNDDDGPYCIGNTASIDFTPPVSGNYWVYITDSPCFLLSRPGTLQYKYSQASAVPTLSSFAPTSGPVGTSVALFGTNLTQITSAELNGQTCAILSQTDNLIYIVVPAGATTGAIRLNYSGGTLTTAPQDFIVTAPSVSFCTVAPLSRGTITPAFSYQTVNGLQGSSPHWSFVATAGTTYTFSTCGSSFDTQISIYDTLRALKDGNDNNGPICVGNAASIEFTPTISGTYSVLLTGANCTGLPGSVNLRYRIGANFGVVSFVPPSGPIGINVSLRGRGFTGLTAVQFGGGSVNAPNFSVTSDSTLNVRVPAGAVSGSICIVAGTKTACSSSPFTLTAIPTFCGVANTGLLNPILSQRSVPLASGSRHAFHFTGTANATYAFSTCGVGTSDTKIRIYDAAGAVVATNDNDGPFCVGNKASINFVPTLSGDYFVLVTDNDCDVLADNGELKYSSLPVPSTPIITSFSPTFGTAGTIVRILGRYFTNASDVSFNTTSARAFTIISDTLISAIVATGTTTGRVSVTTPLGRVQSTFNFTVNNCASTRVLFTMAPLGNNQFRVRSTPVGINLTYLLDGEITVDATGVFTAAPGTHIIRAINAQGCFAESAFRNNGVVACGQRLTGGGTGADTLSFYETTVPNQGETMLVLFDQGVVPLRSRIYYQGASFAFASPSVSNPRNLFYSPNNATSGPAVIEVRSSLGTSFGAWLNCPTTSATAQAMINGTANACGKQLVHSTYPAQNTTNGTVSSTIRAGAGRIVQLNIRSFAIGGSDTLLIYDGPSTTSPILTKLFGSFSTINKTHLSTDTALTIVAKANSFSMGGFIVDVNCVENAPPSIAMGSLSSSAVCTGGSFTVPFSLIGPFVYPDTLQVEISQSATFDTLLMIGQAITRINNGAVTATLPPAAQPGAYFVRIVGGVMRSNQSTLSVGPTPSLPTINANGQTAVCQGDTLILSANAPGVSGYIWSTGAATSSIKVSAAGSYTLQTVIGTCTSAVSAPTIVTINPTPALPTINANGPTVFCQGDTLILSANAPGASGVIWSTGATTSAIKVSVAGSYSLRTIVGTCTSAVSVPTVVTINPTPAMPTIDTNGTTTFCQGDTLILTANAPGVSGYIWSTGAKTSSIKVSAAGSYTLRTVIGTCTSAVSSPIIVSINPTPAAPAINANGPTTFCQGDTLMLSANAPGASGYIWSTGATTSSIKVSASGSYTLRTVVGTCTSAVSAPTIVIIKPTPALPTINANGLTALCQGDTLILSANAPGASGYIWSTGGTNSSIKVNAAGSYTLRVINGSCTSAVSAPTVVTINPTPAVPTINANGSTALCQGDTLILSAIALGASGYIWSTGRTTSSIKVSAAGSYTLRVINGSCTSAVSAPTVVTLNPSSAVTLVLRNDTVFAIGTSPGVTYQWSFNGSPQVGITTPYIVARAGGNYAATVTLGTCVTPSVPLLVVGLADGIKAGDLKLVPNPAIGQVRLQLTTPMNNAEVRLLNTLGQMVRTYNISTDENQAAELDLSGVSVGTYMVHVMGTSVRKALVVR